MWWLAHCTKLSPSRLKTSVIRSTREHSSLAFIGPGVDGSRAMALKVMPHLPRAKLAPQQNVMSIEHHASLALALDPGGPSENEIRRQLETAAITVLGINLQSRPGARTLTLRVSKPRRRSEAAIPAVVDELNRRSGVAGLEWRCLD